MHINPRTGAFNREPYPALIAGPVLCLWVFIFLYALVGPPSYRAPIKTLLPSDKGVEVTIGRSDRLREVFSGAGYRLEWIRDGNAVPRLYLKHLPGDLRAETDTGRRKDLFLRILLPLVLRANEIVAAQRKALLAIRKKLAAGTSLDQEEAATLDALSQEYGVEKNDLDSLVRRVDEVPVSIALAQGSVESGWGTSRFARKEQALFGQWTTADYAGMVPEERGEERTHKVRSFRWLLDSARSYLRNLNTHGAYTDFRKRRAQMRATGAALDGDALVDTLWVYAEKANYVDVLRSVIDVNRLRLFDGARLQKAARQGPGRLSARAPGVGNQRR